jgi:hypothetical protein
MKLLTCLPLNEIGHPPGSPQAGTVTQGLRPLLETTAQLLQLVGLQPGFTTRAAGFLESLSALSFPGLMPPADRLSMNLELAGHLSLAKALVKEFSGFKSPLFELLKIAFNAFGIAHAQT